MDTKAAQLQDDAAPAASEPRVGKLGGTTAFRSDPRRPYWVLCISAYEDDLAELDARVEKLKARFPRASRSWLIRLAIKRLDDATITDSERP